MTINISTLLGGIDLNELLANIQNLRTLGPKALESLRAALLNAAKNDPAVQALLTALESVLDPILRISPEELARLDQSRHSINIRVSHDYPHDDPTSSPPPTTAFLYGKQLTIPPRDTDDAHFLRVGDVVWHNGAPERWIVFSADNPDRYDRPGPESGWMVLETIT